MPRRFPTKPGPKSQTQSKIISENASLGEESVTGSDNDGSSLQPLSRRNIANKSQLATGPRGFHTPSEDDNNTDYGLEFTTSHIPSLSPRRCSTLRSAADPQSGNLSGDNAREATEATNKKHSRSKKQKNKNVAKQQSNMARKATTNGPQTSAAAPSQAVRRRKQLNPLQVEERFWNEVRMLQNRTTCLVPMLPFSRLVREILQEASTEVKFITAKAMESLQVSTEIYITQRLQDAYMLTLHRGRVTLTVRDLQLITYLKENV